MALFGKKNKEKKEEIKESQKGPTDTVDETKPAAQMPKGGDDHAYGVVLSPHLTEKANAMAGLNKYVFKIAKNANKIDVKKAIEKMYKVKVKKVAISFNPAKNRRIGKHEGKKAGFKKAMVTLAEGDKIDIIS